MGLQIAARKAGNVTILDLQGRITIGISNDALGAELRRLGETAPCDVLVNLAGVQQVDSSGISTLMRNVNPSAAQVVCAHGRPAASATKSPPLGLRAPPS